MSYERNCRKLHGNISWNGYGNAIIGRYGGCFEEDIWWVLWYRQKLSGTREASNGGRVGVCIIHGLNISHKELTYSLQKSIGYRNKVLIHMLLGERLVEFNHRALPTSTQRMTIKDIPHALNLLHNGSPYVHATGLTNLNTSISQTHIYSTIMTLISSSSYLKKS